MTVRSSSGSYEIVRTTIQEVRNHVPSNAFVISDSNVADLYGSSVAEQGKLLILPAGESTKSLDYFGRCLSWLATERANRKSVVVALGGGVIGDLVGFVASAYMRGVSYIQVPTTLLAQVDSSVGGKVAIDLPEGKNLAGAFHPPSKVLLLEETLASLPVRQIRNGLAEVFKTGFIAEPQLLQPASSADASNLGSIVDECVRFKAGVVEEDEFETKGLRAILNFGHTIGHAIETVLGYEELLHGEAISIGMVLEARLGETLGITEPGVGVTVADYLSRASLPITHPVLNRQNELISAMYRDKKSTDGKLTFSLLERIGSCRLVADVSEQDVRTALAE